MSGRTAARAIGTAVQPADLEGADKIYVDNYDTIAEAVTAWQAIGAGAVLAFGSGTYTEDLTIQTNATGQSIIGEGMLATKLQNIAIEVKHSQFYAGEFQTEDTGAASANAGIHLNDTSGARRDTFVSHVRMLGWQYNILDADDGARVVVEDCDILLATLDNIHITGNVTTANDQGDMIISNCLIRGALRYGVNVVKGGTILLSSCKIQGNNKANIFADVSADSEYLCRQLMLSNCSVENDSTWAGSTGRSFSITAFADNGDGTVRVTTSAAHKFQAGMEEITISGTTNYNGDYSVKAVINATQFDITATWISNDATGTVDAPPWDIHLVSNGTSRINDISIDGGDLNYAYFEGGINIKVNAIVKRQLRLGSAVRGATIMHQPMGRFDGAGVGAVLPLDVEGGATFIRYGKSNPEDNSTNFQSGGLIWQTEQGWFARYTVTIANDAVHTFVRPAGSRSRTFKATASIRNEPWALEAFMNWVKPAGYAVFSWDNLVAWNSSVDTNGGVYTGTTGAVGNITMSVQGGNTFYLENRSGASQEFHIVLQA